MRLLVLAILLLASMTSHAALSPACEAAIRKNADILLVESEVVRKEMRNEVSRAQNTGDKTAVLLFAIVFGPTTNAVRFESAVRNLTEEKKLTPREERAVQRVCDNDLQITPDVFNY